MVGEDIWAGLADQFVDGAYASVKGFVRTYVLHNQLLEHLPPAPARVLDVGGGAGHQSFPLAKAGYEVTLLDPSAAMLDRAQSAMVQAVMTRRLANMRGSARRTITFASTRMPGTADVGYARRFTRR